MENYHERFTDQYELLELATANVQGHIKRFGLKLPTFDQIKELRRQ